MKRTVILKTILACLTLSSMPLMAENSDISQWKNVLYVQSMSVQKGTTSCTLSVMMNNEAESQGFGFYICLPEGFSFATDGNDDPDVRLSTKRTDATHIDNFVAKFQTDGSVKVIASPQDGDGLITGNEGEVALVNIRIPEDCPAGDYTITIREPKVTLTTGFPAEWETDEVVSTLTVTAGKVLDENSVEMPEAATNVNVTVLRTINANEWSTLCLPFAMTEAQVKEAFGDDVELGDFTSYDTTKDAGDNIESISVNFNTVTAIEANHPYIIKVSSAITEFTVDGVDIAPTANPCKNYYSTGKKPKLLGSFVGTYVADFDFYSAADNYPLFLSGNKFYYATEDTQHMKAFRAFFDFDDYLPEAEEASSSRILMTFGNSETTGVQSLKREEVSHIYDLQGRRVEEPAKGLYIKNNKKVVIK